MTKAEINYLKELNVSYCSLTHNKNNLQIIESEMTFLTAAKETAIKDMETFKNRIHEEMEKRSNDLMTQLLDQFNEKRNALLDKQKVITEENGLLNDTLMQAKRISKTGKLGKLKPISESLQKVNDKAQPVSSNLELGENYLAFDSNKGSDQGWRVSDGTRFLPRYLPVNTVLGKTGFGHPKWEKPGKTQLRYFFKQFSTWIKDLIGPWNV